MGLSLSVAGVPAFAAVPFGYLEGIHGGFNAGGGLLPITGWALDDDGIERVELYVDNQVAALTDYGRNRPDVEAVFPGYPDGALAGFGVFLDSTHYSNDLHRISARVTSNSGEQVFLGPLTIQINNTTSNLAPFGAITFPNPSAELFGTCDLSDPFRRLSVISGWALDAGIETGDTGVKYVELLINGGLYANTVVDCFSDPGYGGLTDCYGLPSLDVEHEYPTVANSPHARYRFVLDVGSLISQGFYVQGFHEITIRAGDYAGNFANIAEIPVAFFCDENTGNEGSFGFIDGPDPTTLIAGVTNVFGWALDPEGISGVQVWLDGTFVGDAETGIFRPDVLAYYPGFPDSLGAGWRFFLDTTQTSNGLHHVQAVAVDEFGATNIIGERYFEIRN
ncbi:MAG: hypothetical protein ABI639_08475 [Thermoanaerobaculia bacterium]